MKFRADASCHARPAAAEGNAALGCPSAGEVMRRPGWRLTTAGTATRGSSWRNGTQAGSELGDFLRLTAGGRCSARLLHCPVGLGTFQKTPVYTSRSACTLEFTSDPYQSRSVLAATDRMSFSLPPVIAKMSLLSRSRRSWVVFTTVLSGWASSTSQNRP